MLLVKSPNALRLVKRLMYHQSSSYRNNSWSHAAVAAGRSEMMSCDRWGCMSVGGGGRARWGRQGGGYSCSLGEEEDKNLPSVSSHVTHTPYLKMLRGGKCVPAPTRTLETAFASISISWPNNPISASRVMLSLSYVDVHTHIHTHTQHKCTSWKRGFEQLHHQFRAESRRGGVCRSFTICSPHTQNKTSQENQSHSKPDEGRQALLRWYREKEKYLQSSVWACVCVFLCLCVWTRGLFPCSASSSS